MKHMRISGAQIPPQTFPNANQNKKYMYNPRPQNIFAPSEAKQNRTSTKKKNDKNKQKQHQQSTSILGRRYPSSHNHGFSLKKKKKDGVYLQNEFPLII